MKQFVYQFREGDASMRALLGGKGANLAEMTKIGLPVPQGFTISTEACTQYYEDGKQINADIQAEIMRNITELENITGKKFGDKVNPLLVSVRSGARASMPGMMDTILNLGLNEEVVETLAAKSGNPRWAWDCYRRFIQMFSDVVMEVGKKYFEELIDKMKKEKGVEFDAVLSSEDILSVGAAKYARMVGRSIPEDLSIIGYNNSNLCLCCDPELTSVDNKLKAICDQCVTTLLAVLDGKRDLPQKTIFTGELIKRSSTLQLSPVSPR